MTMTKDEILPNTRVATVNDFKSDDGKFKTNRKYYYWCRGNRKFMPWLTQRLSTKEEMQLQIDLIKQKINNKEIIVDE